MKIENVNVYGLDFAIKSSKYPMAINTGDVNAEITQTCKNLGSSATGSGHDNYLAHIVVQFDLTFSNKAWVEMERYHFFEMNSQSTMHKIAKFNLFEQYNEYVDEYIINRMYELKEQYNKTKDKEDYLKLLYSNPSGFELTAGITTNYRQLKTIYHQRKDHRLPEWRKFCEWILTLPYFKELCMGGDNA